MPSDPFKSNDRQDVQVPRTIAEQAALHLPVASKARASIRKILLRDFGCHAIFGLTFLVIAGATYVSGLSVEYDDLHALRLLTPVSKFALPLGGWLIVQRIRSIRQVFAVGVEVDGVIRGRGRFNHRGKVECEYVFREKVYRTLVHPRLAGPVPHLDHGNVVRMMVHPDSPEIAYVKELFVA